VAALEVPVCEHASGLRLPGRWQSQVEFGYGEQEPSGSLCLAALMLPRAVLPTSDLLILEDGVLLGRQKLYLGRPGVTALICGSQYTRDLTGLVVSRDELFLHNLARLSRWADDLRHQLSRVLDSVRWTAEAEALLQPVFARRIVPRS
jgi:hypothetical protein